jgi:hypothetical protein
MMPHTAADGWWGAIKAATLAPLTPTLYLAPAAARQPIS